MGAAAASALAALALAAGSASADPAPFDLQGPGLQVKVTHAGASLPIAEVPNLAAGDKLGFGGEAALGQGRYLIVVAFLRGATDPPPRQWFFQIRPGKKGAPPAPVTTPAGARQAIVLMAPRTAGAFAALVEAVRGRPGVFVRASQDLNQASQDRSRLDAYLAGVRASEQDDPAALKSTAPLMARSLMIKLNDDCFQKMPELQAACLAQGKEALVLADSESASLFDTLTSGASADLALQISDSPQMRFGYYSSYVGAAIDLVRILNSFRTAHFQYIPALATVRDDRVSLLLNSPPSFGDPKSVLVAALPPVEAPQTPALRAVDPKETYCAYRPGLVLPVEGAPLVYSTRYAHDLVLRIRLKGGQSVDTPVRAQAQKGGLVVETAGLAGASLGEGAEGVLHGVWGFTPFDGPKFSLRAEPAPAWTLSDEARRAIVAGRTDAVTLDGEAACVESVALQPPAGPPIPVAWKPAGPGKLALTLALGKHEPGPLRLAVRAYGAARPQLVDLQAYPPPSRIDAFVFHAGDHGGVLKGDKLDQVAALRVDGATLTPDAAQPVEGELALSAAKPAALAALPPGRALKVGVELKDGRNEQVEATVASPRPVVALIAKDVRRPASAGALAISLGDASEAPHDGVLAFSFKAQQPLGPPDALRVEVATANGAGAVSLTPKDGLVLEDANIAVATVDLAKAFDASAFGPLRFRVVEGDAASDWTPLGALVRLPTIKRLRCPKAQGDCALTGERLFLLSAVSADPSFARSAAVQPGFTGRAIDVPRPSSGILYARLRDAPEVVNTVQVAGPAPRAAGRAD
ncbi:MAG TPA: hypothetical protein VGG29_16785 [Caulobacteraceae bacterium]